MLKQWLVSAAMRTRGGQSAHNKHLPRCALELAPFWHWVQFDLPQEQKFKRECHYVIEAAVYLSYAKHDARCSLT